MRKLHPSSTNSNLLISLAVFLILASIIIVEFNISKNLLDNNVLLVDMYFDIDPLLRMDYQSFGYKFNLSHPLHLALLFPAMEALEFFGYLASPERFILINVFFGAILLFLFMNFSRILFKDRVFSYLLSLLYALNFSNIVFTIIPDTFLFAQLSIALTFFVFYLGYKKKKWEPKTFFVLKIVLGLLVTGITTTNFITYFITLAIFEFDAKKTDVKSALLHISSISILIAAAILGLFLLQVFVAPNFCDSCLSYWTGKFIKENSNSADLGTIVSYLDQISGKAGNYFVSNQSQFFRNLLGFPSSIKNTFFPTLPTGATHTRFSFNTTNLAFQNFINWTITTAVLAIIYFGKENASRPLWLSLFLSLFANIIFHVLWGREFFLYSQHYTFQLFALLAFGLHWFYKKSPRNLILVMAIIICIQVYFVWNVTRSIFLDF